MITLTKKEELELEIQAIKAEKDALILAKQDELDNPRLKQAEQLVQAYNDYERAKDNYKLLFANFYDNGWKFDADVYYDEERKRVLSGAFTLSLEADKLKK